MNRRYRFHRQHLGTALADDAISYAQSGAIVADATAATAATADRQTFYDDSVARQDMEDPEWRGVFVLDTVSRSVPDL